MKVVGVARRPAPARRCRARSSCSPATGATSASAPAAISARSQRAARPGAPGVGSRQQQEVGDQPSHPARGAERPVDDLGLLAGLAALLEPRLQQLEVGEDAGQRRAQLVRGVGDELALGLDHLLGLAAGGVELAQHLIERLGELADLVLGLGLRQPQRRVAGGRDLASRRGQRGDRAHRPAGDRDPGERGQQRAAERRRPRAAARAGRSRRRASLGSRRTGRRPARCKEFVTAPAGRRRRRRPTRMISSVEGAPKCGCAGVPATERLPSESTMSSLPFVTMRCDRVARIVEVEARRRPGWRSRRSPDEVVLEPGLRPAGRRPARSRRGSRSVSPAETAAIRQRTGQRRGAKRRDSAQPSSRGARRT